MNYPFYKNYYYPATEVSLPVRRETKPARKVIHVPVMDGSEKRSRSRVDSAVKIQKIFRGFFVRKCVKKIAAIKAEVEEMENRITSEETMELIKKDRKERLKVNEMLMRLLLKLDSVPGVDFGVRDCRKAVIKKVIRLQEVVDSIASDETLDQKSTFPESDRNPNSNSNSKLELQNNGESQESSEFEARAIDIPAVESRANVEGDEGAALEIEGNVAKPASKSNLNSDSNSLENDAVNQKLESQNIPEAIDVENRANIEAEALGSNSISNSQEKIVDQNRESQSEPPEIDVAKSTPELDSNSNLPENNADAVESKDPMTGNDERAENEFAESMELSQDESQTGSSADPNEDDGSDTDTSEKHENGEEEMEEVDEAKQVNSGKKNIELLEKLVEENEKMMGLMTDLFKKNEMQTQLLSSLSHRVEHLEKAFMCERFRRKKKRNGTCS